MGKLDGRVAIVTGGARGQGAAEAAALRREGAEVVVTDVRPDGAATARQLGATFVAHDVADERSWANVVEQATSRFGRVDVLVNNAGIVHTAGLLDTDEAAYRHVVDVNQIGTFLGIRAVAPVMIAQRSGAIINISSVAGLRGFRVGFSYGASKFAIGGMTKCAALELAGHGIRVNSVHPGLIETDMLDALTGGSADVRDALVERLPMRRLGQATDIAELVVFLASDDSSYSTGSEFVADGGMIL
ncbi:MAG: SDR family NAD(P)-dependent oxidoreductase [Ilumatobacteraceae bacterium]